MDFHEVKDQLELHKQNLIKKLQNGNLTKEESETVRSSIDNYEYIIELTDMNHYERGFFR